MWVTKQDSHSALQPRFSWKSSTALGSLIGAQGQLTFEGEVLPGTTAWKPLP